MFDPLMIAGREFKSRLFLGTAGYPNRQVMLDAVAASGTEMVTASIRRISLAGDDESLIDLIPKHIQFLPNTAGCQTAKDAVLTAELAAHAIRAGCRWISVREKDMSEDDQVALVRAVLPIGWRHGARVSLHGDARKGGERRRCASGRTKQSDRCAQVVGSRQAHRCIDPHRH